MALQFERVAQRKGSPGRVKQTLAEFYREHYGAEMPVSTVRAYGERWLGARKAETAASTLRRYRDGIRGFLAWLGADRAAGGLEEVTPQQIIEYRDALLARLAPATANTHLKLLKRLFRNARRDGFILQDPAENVAPVRARGRESAARRPFTVPELRAVLEAAGEEWRSLIKFGLYTGQRLGDLATLAWAQINLERDEIALTTRKTGKRLLIPVAGPLREHILSLPAGDDPRGPVHPRAFETVAAQNGRVGTLSNQFAELLVAAGLRKPWGRKGHGAGRGGRRAGSELSFHSLRHTCVSLLKDAAVPDAVVMALVGHESVAMSERYTHVGIDSLRKAAGALPEL